VRLVYSLPVPPRQPDSSWHACIILHLTALLQLLVTWLMRSGTSMRWQIALPRANNHEPLLPALYIEHPSPAKTPAMRCALVRRQIDKSFTKGSSFASPCALLH